MVVAEGRLLGAVARRARARRARRAACRRWRPTSRCWSLDERRPIAGQIRALRPRARRPARRGARAPTALLDRHPAELQAIPWHLLIADEALRYANPATEAHQALEQVRFGVGGGLLAADRHAARQERRAPRRARRARRRRRGDDPRAPQHARGRRPASTRSTPTACGSTTARTSCASPARTCRPGCPRSAPPSRSRSTPTPRWPSCWRRSASGGREAYRRLLERAARAQDDLEPGSRALPARARRARPRPGRRARQRRRLRRRLRRPRDAHALQGRARPGARPPGARRRGDARRRRRPAAAARHHRPDARRRSPARSRCSCSPSASAACASSPRTLRERHGVEAHVADGSITGREFEALKRRFTAGEFPVLCLVAGRPARATTSRTPRCSCHLDLPWLPAGLEQRVGRAARPGAARGWVQTYIPYIRGAGIEHVVSILSPRGGEHHQVLDSFEGVKASRVHDRHPARRRSPARSPPARTTPATPRPPRGCASRPASSAPEPAAAAPAAAGRHPYHHR